LSVELLENSKKWYKHYSTLNQVESCEFLKETFRYTLPKEFVKKINFVNLFIDRFNGLKRERQFDKMRELYDSIVPQKHACGEEFFYVDKYMIDYYLFKGDLDGVKKHLESFKEFPEKSIDSLLPVFNKLIFYHYTATALDLALSIYFKVSDSDKLVPGAEGDFSRFIYMEKVQEVYQLLKTGGKLDKTELIKYLKKFGFVVKDRLVTIELMLSDDFSGRADFTDFQEAKAEFLYNTMLLFSKYMFKDKNVSFPAAASIWFEAMEILINGDEEEELLGDFDDVFTLNSRRFRNEIFERYGIFSFTDVSAFYLVWGMIYVYDFLLKYDYISDDVHATAMLAISSMQAEITMVRAENLWEYTFVHHWGKPDSVSERNFIIEKEAFERTFSQKQEITKEPKRAFNKVDKRAANNRCPCGSGKKYKNCCGSNIISDFICVSEQISFDM